MTPTLSRRHLLGATLATVVLRPAQADAPELEALIRAWAGTVVPRPGRVTLEIAPLVENGNVVPISVHADSPMTATEHVQEIAVFNQRNPQHDVARFVLGPANGRALVSTRIRLATSQQIAALARFSDGSIGIHRVDVLVTLAACIEG